MVENSENGTVNEETIFAYKQDGILVTADYYGGSVLYGKIIAILERNCLNILYQCVTIQNELKAGKAKAVISVTKNGKMKLALDWEWLGGLNGKGKSIFIEK